MALPVLRRQHAAEQQERSAQGEGGGNPVGRWSPWVELTDLHDRLGQLWSGTAGESVGVTAPLGGGWRPAADVEETDEAYRVELELPGVDREDVSLEFGGGELAVTGEVTQRERVGFWRTRTRPVGRFAYHVELPTDVESDRVSAALDCGVLTVTVPKTATACRRRIPIRS